MGTRASSDLSSRAFVALALALPLALAGIHARLGHGGDLAFFHQWYLAFREGPAFYRDGPGLNYPIVGVLLVCGPAWLVEQVVGATLTLDAFWGVMKASLVLAEVALVLGVAALLDALGARRPRASALVLYALPSTWASGAWFGQIDVWGSVFLVCALLGLVRYRAEGRGAWLALGLFGAHAALLDKQLTLFSMPAIAALLVLALRERGTRAHVLATIGSPLVWLVPDPFLVLPEGHRSHLAYALFGHGLSHGGLAVTNGASVWCLFAAGDTPADEVRLLGVSSLVIGLVLFALVVGAGAIAVWREKATSRSLVWHAALSQIAMATLLTGVHERYLVHGALIGGALVLVERGEGLRGLAAARLVLCIGTMVVWGVYVLSSLHYDAFVSSGLGLLGAPTLAALLSLAWLGVELASRFKRV